MIFRTHIEMGFPSWQVGMEISINELAVINQSWISSSLQTVAYWWHMTTNNDYHPPSSPIIQAGSPFTDQLDWIELVMLT